MPVLGTASPEGERECQKGQAIVLIALMLAVLVSMVALAVDGSRAYALRRDLQAAVDAAALAAGDKLQTTGSYVSAEQAATAIFGTNLRLYDAPSCSPGYGSPGASTYTVSCTYSDGTVLTQVVATLGPQGSQFALAATRSLDLQFARILTNGVSPLIGAASAGGVNNLLYTPAVAALDQAGCGGLGGSAVNINGSGTLYVNGDLVSNGAISAMDSTQVTGDVYARCQSSVSNVTTRCYPTGATTPCAYPDVAGATRSGYRLVDPNFPSPGVIGSSQGLPNANVVLPPGIYTAMPAFNNRHCWFLSGGVYTWQAGYANSRDFVSNELKPPDEPDSTSNTDRANNQFWNTNGVNCSGSAQVNVVTGTRDIPFGRWSFVLTATRTDTYNGVSYARESAPSMCYRATVRNHAENVQITVSNVPGATAYNIYASPPGNNGCLGPFGLAGSLPVSGPVLNTNTDPCPAFTGNGCTLGHESITLDTQLSPPFAPNANAAPGVVGAYPPDPETTPLASGLPNQNPARAPGPRGDRANENACKTSGGVLTNCPNAVTPGAVEFYLPAGSCLNNLNTADTYVFSGYQYNWVGVFEPGASSPPANTCSNTLGASSNSAFVGMLYMPSASVSVTSAYGFESAGTGGLWADTVSFTGSMPSLAYNANYAPGPPAAKLVG